MKFLDWLKQKDISEAGTGTGDVAMFARPIFSSPIKRSAFWPWGEVDPFFKKKTEGTFARWAKHHFGEQMSQMANEPSVHSGGPIPMKAVRSSAQTLPQGDMPSLQMPVGKMKKSK
jgi:hypothetical protein